MQLERRVVAAATALILSIALVGPAPTAAGATIPAAPATRSSVASSAAASTPQASPSPAADPAFGQTNLGNYAFNGIVRAATTDPATGVVYVGGDFTQVGVRTGRVAMVNPPGSGSDQLTATSPEVIGQQLSVFPDDSSHYFLGGRMASINGDGVQRTPLVRMTSSGQVDTSWQPHGLCSKWQTIGWDIGEYLVSAVDVATDTTGLSTVGLQLIDKATGNAYLLGAGSSSACPASSRMWPSTGVLPQLSGCTGWYACQGAVSNVAFDSASNVLIVQTWALACKTQADCATAQDYNALAAYDMSTGRRLWSTRLAAPPPADWPSSAQWGSYLSAMAAFNGAILAEGQFELGPTDPDPSATASTMILMDEHTGTILQRWNDSGEQDMADPAQTKAPPTVCTPGDSSDYDFLQALLIRRSATSVIG